MNRLLPFMFALVALLLSPLALAAPQLQTSVSPDTIEVGSTTTVALTVSPGEKVSQAELRSLPAGLTLVGQNVMPSFEVNFSTGQMTQSARIMFRVQASREGTFVIGPPAVVSDGTRYTGSRVTLKVVAKGTLPQRQINPFDPFGLLGPGGPFQGMDQQPMDNLEPSYPIDPRLNLDHARGSGTFLHATVDKSQAIVGEQVTLIVYVYVDVTAPEPQFSDPHEVGTSDFLRKSLMKDDAGIQRMGFARVGGRTFAVGLVRKYALFPLHAGELSITPMRLAVGRGERDTETLSVHVTEPPIAGRPPGYVMGDAGHFTLSADVAPRDVQRGGAVAVNVDLTGWGNLPSTLSVPARPGVTWLDPEVKDDMHVLDAQTAGASDVWGGARHFSYVVQPTKEGDLDLGEIAASFYDPREHAYGVARATLGVIHVKPGAAPPDQDGKKLLSNMPQLRPQMGSTRGAEAHLDDSNVFFGLLALPSMLFGLALSGRRIARVASERARERKTSPIAELKQRLRALETASAGDDSRAIDGATIRVLEAGALAHAGVNVRGIGGEEIVSVLTRAGVSADAAAKLRDLLDACAAARFSPDGASVLEARKRGDRAREVVNGLQEGTASRR